MGVCGARPRHPGGGHPGDRRGRRDPCRAISRAAGKEMPRATGRTGGRRNHGRGPRGLRGARTGGGNRLSRREDRKSRLFQSRSEEHTSELQSLMRISYAVFCLKKKNTTKIYKKQTSLYEKITALIRTLIPTARHITT